MQRFSSGGVAYLRKLLYTVCTIVIIALAGSTLSQGELCAQLLAGILCLCLQMVGELGPYKWWVSWAPYKAVLISIHL